MSPTSSWFNRSAGVVHLPELPVLPDTISVIVISSGCCFATQFHVAFSATANGVGSFAGCPFFLLTIVSPTSSTRRSQKRRWSWRKVICKQAMVSLRQGLVATLPSLVHQKLQLHWSHGCDAVYVVKHKSGSPTHFSISQVSQGTWLQWQCTCSSFWRHTLHVWPRGVFSSAEWSPSAKWL